MGCFRKAGLFFLLVVPSAQAWEKHTLLTEIITTTQAQLHADDRPKWADKSWNVTLPCGGEEKQQFAKWAMAFELNAERMPPLTTTGCGEKKAIPVATLMSRFVDEPDTGMDQELPDAFDSKNERAWMGGKKGTGSQGFRHMLFLGWNWKEPLASLQMPMEQVGQGHALRHVATACSLQRPRRADLSLFWRIRALSWSLHFCRTSHSLGTARRFRP